MPRWFGQLSLLWFVVVATVLAEILTRYREYVFPQRPWPDWLFVLVCLSILIAIVGWGTRETRGDMIRKYDSLSDKITRSEATLVKARKERWAPDAISSLEKELATLLAEREAMRRIR